MTETSERAGMRGWYIVGFLSLLYGLSIVDRLALALLADPVMKSFAISASQMGLLLGAGFALLYSAMGLPIAHILDQGRRKQIVAIGVALWSISTLLSAFARNYPELLICRSGVAIGEAVLTPAAISLIGDLFPPNRRRLPISIYSSVSSLMATGSYVVGAAALEVATRWSGPVGMESWRITLLIVGAPGLMLALLFALTIREPERRQEAGGLEESEAAGISELWAYLVANRRFYLPFYGALGSISTLLYALLSWAPTFVSRSQEMTTAEAGYLVGFVGMVSGFFGTFLWPALAEKIDRVRSEDGLPIVLIICVAIGTAGTLLATTTGSRALLAAGLAGAMLTLPPICTVLSSLLIQDQGPTSFRARLIALNVLTVNLFGYTVGPQFVGAYVDASGGATIEGAVFWLAAVAGFLSFILFIISRRRLIG